MVKETNIRLMITLSKKQDAWLTKFAKSINKTKSQAIAWIMAKKANEIYEIIKMKKNEDMNKEEFEELCRIAKTPWIE